VTRPLSRRIPTVRVVPVAVAVAALLGLAGCGGEDAVDTTPTQATTLPPTTLPDSSGPSASQSSPPTGTTPTATTPTATTPATTSPTNTPSTTPSTTPSPTPSPTPSTTVTPPPTSVAPPRTAGLASALVPAADLPRDPSGRPWNAGADVRGSSVATASACQRAPLTSIGATKVVQRGYDNRNPGSVVNTVAAFADDDSARRGYAVLEAWVRDCAGTLREHGKRPMNTPSGFGPVQAQTSPAGWAVVFYGPVRNDPNAAHIEGQSVVVDDETLSWIVYRSIGQDYNYESGQAPPERAAVVMAARLRALD